MKFNTTNIQKAIQQITAQKVTLCDEKQGASWLKAIEKAEKNLNENPSIYFVDGTLSFKSLESKKTRIVTASGCVASFCECKDGISYHKAMHSILVRYFELETEPLTEGERFVYQNGGLETHYVVENGKLVKTLEKCAGIRMWARGKTVPVTPPPVTAEIVQFPQRNIDLPKAA